VWIFYARAVSERLFEVGPLRGHRGGSGTPALLLHGGAAVPDYLGSLAGELAGIFTTYRYTQRGTPPSGGEPPYTIETHVRDALSVLDRFKVERAWIVGHSWGGHLALHLLVAHPERLLGVVAVDPLGAFAGAFAEMDGRRRSALSADENARLDSIEARRRTGDVTETELVERFALVWPLYFADPARAIPPPEHVGLEASIEVNRSIVDHFERRTLVKGLQTVALPVLFVHGELSVIPVWSTAETAELIPGAKVVVAPGCGHFPWIDRPGSVRRAVEAFLPG
jgi:pimeloyl-ACP methyl ester carboxylesterase